MLSAQCQALQALTPESGVDLGQQQGTDLTRDQEISNSKQTIEIKGTPNTKVALFVARHSAFLSPFLSVAYCWYIKKQILSGAGFIERPPKHWYGDFGML